MPLWLLKATHWDSGNVVLIACISNVPCGCLVGLEATNIVSHLQFTYEDPETQYPVFPLMEILLFEKYHWWLSPYRKLPCMYSAFFVFISDLFIIIIKAMESLVYQIEHISTNP